MKETPEHTDPPLLIHAQVMDPAGPARSLELESLDHWQPEDGPLWAHFDANHHDLRRWLTGPGRLPAPVANALVATETRPRATISTEGLLLVLRGVNLNPGAEPEDMVSIRLWVDKDRMISTRRRKLLSVVDTRKSLEERPAQGVTDILLRLVDRLVERINDAVNQVEDEVALLEEDVLDAPQSESRSRLSELRREAIALRRYLGPQRDALGRLQTDPPEWFNAEDRLRLREIYDRMVRLVEDLDAVRERATVIHEELVSSLSDQLNKRMYLLSITAALFLPMGFLTGLLGINVGGIPGADNPWAFWIFSGMLASILGAQVIYFVRNRWF